MTAQNSINANTSTPLSPANGGTGVSNGTNNLTISGTSAINQDVTTGANVSFGGVTLGTNGYIQGLSSSTYTLNAYNTMSSSQTNLMSISPGNPPTWQLGGAAFTGNIDNCEIGFSNPSSGAFTTLSQGGNAISLGGSFTMSGVHTFTGNLTGNTNVTFPTSGTLATVGGGGVTWSVSSTNITLSANTGVIASGMTFITFTLPSTFNVGDIFEVANAPSTILTLAQSSGITVYYGSQQTTTGTGGNLQSTASGCTLKLVGFVANTSLIVVSGIGQWQGT